MLFGQVFICSFHTLRKVTVCRKCLNLSKVKECSYQSWITLSTSPSGKEKKFLIYPSQTVPLVNKSPLLYKHRWNTRWAFGRKHDIFIRENNMLSSHVKMSPLLRLHNKSRVSHQKLVKGNGLVFHWCS